MTRKCEYNCETKISKFVKANTINTKLKELSKGHKWSFTKIWHCQVLEQIINPVVIEKLELCQRNQRMEKRSVQRKQLGDKQRKK